MCGIVGFSGKGKYDLLKIKFLLYWNSIERGTDSTGIYIPEVGIVKDNVRAEFFINDDKHISKLTPSDTLLAHVRAKTVGANTIANAHPFKYGRLVGLHNGSLKNHIRLCTEYDFKISEYDVDSQVLISAMNKNFEDFEESVERFKVLEEYEGAAALLFYDEWEDVIYACHDKERPLFYGYINDGKDMYISSIKDSLEVIGCKEVTSFPINTVHKIKAGEIIATFAYTPYVQPVIDKVLKIAAFSDIIIDKEGKITLPSDCKGIITTAIRGTMLEKFWLNVDSLCLPMKGDFTHGNWYYCKKSIPGNNPYNDKLIVIDNKGNDGEIYIRNISTSNFIPVVDDYVVLTFDISNKKKKLIAKEGDICKVTQYKYQDDIMTVSRISDNKSIYLYSECVRNLKYGEREEVIKKLKADNEEARKLQLAKAQQAVMFPAPIGIPIVNEPLLIESNSNEVSPFVDPKLVEVLEPEVEELTEEDLIPGTEGYVDADTYTQVILGAMEAAEEIQCCLIMGQTTKALKETDNMVSNLKTIFANIKEDIVI